MPQAIWTGSISFGLVTVPVRLVSATKSQDVRFNQLEAGTGSRIRYRRVSEQTGEEVPNDQIVKGYELENGHYVVLDNDELAALKPTASRMIEIEDFVDLSEIDPVYFEQPYYLVPDKDAAKAYRLLSTRHGGREQGRGRTRSCCGRRRRSWRSVRSTACCASRPCATPTRCSRPTVSWSTPSPSRASGSSRWPASSSTRSRGTFDPEKYHDEYREEVLALIERKAAGEEIVAPAAPEEPAKVLDLMAALEASLARTGAKQPGRGATATKRPAKKAAAKKAPAKADQEVDGQEGRGRRQAHPQVGLAG